MAPFAFQAGRAARDLGVLAALRTPPEGVDSATVCGLTGLPATSVDALLDACLAVGLVAECTPGRWRLTTVGTVWLNDPQVGVDAEFTHAVCWAGLADLGESLRQGKPIGLRHLGPWATIYEGLTSLPDSVRAPWFAYDHSHSDAAFAEALVHLRTAGVRRVLDVGGNTGRFALALLDGDPAATVTILDHPGQVREATANLAAAGFAARGTCQALDLLDHAVAFPTGQDAVWMSQFLDCFGPADVIALLARARRALAPGGRVWVLEVCPDRQHEAAAAASLRLASLYFTAIANGVSRFYRSTDLLAMAASAGLRTVAIHDGLGTAHSLFCFEPAPLPMAD
jgi:SAM-dependent methyltransferase